MGDEISSEVYAALIGAGVAGVALSYTIGKDVVEKYKKKKSLISNLGDNYEMLKSKLEELMAFVNDMDNPLVMKQEIKSTSSFTTWKTRVGKIQKAVRALFDEYDGLVYKSKKKEKAKLSESMVDKCKEIDAVIQNGRFMINHF